MDKKVIKFHFFQGTSPLSRGIRWMTHSRFSHVAIEIDGLIYEAQAGKVRCSNSIWTRNTACSVKTVEFPMSLDKIALAEDWIRGQVGKDYGYRQILSFILNQNKGTRNTFICSELAEKMLVQTGDFPKYKQLIPPGTLEYMIIQTNYTKDSGRSYWQDRSKTEEDLWKKPRVSA